MNPFLPSPGKTVSIDVAATSANVKLADLKGPYSVRVMNDGSATVWIAFGDLNVTASTTADLPVAAGASEVFEGLNQGDDALYAAAIAAGSTGNVYFTPGRGGI